jgi:hypothetical protein
VNSAIGSAKDFLWIPAAAPKPLPCRAPSLSRNLDSLEEHIDEGLRLAKNIDRAGLDKVIGLLRQARNQVVWKMGQP